MPKASLYYAVILMFLFCAAIGSAQKEADTKSKITLNFNRTEYVHRWSQNDLHEFTPPDQADLSKWTDMLSINFYSTLDKLDFRQKYSEAWSKPDT